MGRCPQLFLRKCPNVSIHLQVSYECSGSVHPFAGFVRVQWFCPSICRLRTSAVVLSIHLQVSYECSGSVPCLCDTCSLMPVGIFMFLSMNDFLPGFLYTVVVILMIFYDWSECVMSVLGTTKHSLCNCIDTWQ